VSFEASRTFWPRRPIASESWSSVTFTVAVFLAGSSLMSVISAGRSALMISASTDSFHRMMSIFSPFSSSVIDLMRVPRMPTQAPMQSTRMSAEATAILVR
jgi:hypothetical protein